MGSGESSQSQSEPEHVEQENVQSHHQGIGENLADKQECQNLIDCARENNIDTTDIVNWNEFLNTHQCERFMTELDFTKNLDQSICYVDENLQGPLEELITRLQEPIQEVIVPDEPDMVETVPEEPDMVENVPEEPEDTAPETVVEATPVPVPLEDKPFDVETAFLTCRNIVESNPDRGKQYFLNLPLFKGEGCVNEEIIQRLFEEKEEDVVEPPVEEEDTLTKCKMLVEKYPNEGVEFFKLQPLFKGQGCLGYIPQIFQEEEKVREKIQDEYSLLGKCEKIVQEHPSEGKSFFMSQILFKDQGCLNESIMNQLFPESENDPSEEMVEDGIPPEEFGGKIEVCKSIVSMHPEKGKSFFELQPLFKGEECNTPEILDILFPTN